MNWGIAAFGALCFALGGLCIFIIMHPHSKDAAPTTDGTYVYDEPLIAVDDRGVWEPDRAAEWGNYPKDLQNMLAALDPKVLQKAEKGIIAQPEAGRGTLAT